MEQAMNDPRVVWFITGLLLLVAEFFVPGIVLLFFGFGAWVVALLLFFYPFGMVAQLGVFLIASLLSLLLLRAKIKNLLYSSKLKVKNFPDSLESEIIGQSVEVQESIDPPHPGRVFLHGVSWQAVAEENISKGTRVEIISQNGLLLTVRRIQNASHE